MVRQAAKPKRSVGSKRKRQVSSSSEEEEDSSNTSTNTNIKNFSSNNSTPMKTSPLLNPLSSSKTKKTTAARTVKITGKSSRKRRKSSTTTSSCSSSISSESTSSTETSDNNEESIHNKDSSRAIVPVLQSSSPSSLLLHNNNKEEIHMSKLEKDVGESFFIIFINEKPSCVPVAAPFINTKHLFGQPGILLQDITIRDRPILLLPCPHSGNVTVRPRRRYRLMKFIGEHLCLAGDFAPISENEIINPISITSTSVSSNNNNNTYNNNKGTRRQREAWAMSELMGMMTFLRENPEKTPQDFEALPPEKAAAYHARGSVALLGHCRKGDDNDEDNNNNNNNNNFDDDDNADDDDEEEEGEITQRHQRRWGVGWGKESEM